MKHYEIWLSNEDLAGCVKRYPFKIQAIIWCFLNGYVNTGKGQYFLDPQVEIKEVSNNEQR